MAEYTYTREVVSGKYNINSGTEKNKLQDEIIVALPGKNLSYVNCNGGDVKIGIDTLDAGEKTTLDTTVQDHKDNSATNLIYCYKITGDCSDPSDIDVRLKGYFRKDVFDNLGALSVKEYYTNYDGTTYSDLVVKDEYVYDYDAYGFANYRDETLTWYLEDDTVGTTKTIRKYYDDARSIKEANMRRDNLIGLAQAYGVANITGMHADGIPNGHHFFLSIASEIDNYRVGVLKEEVVTVIQASTETYLTQQMKDDFEDIFDYWT